MCVCGVGRTANDSAQTTQREYTIKSSPRKRDWWRKKLFGLSVRESLWEFTESKEQDFIFLLVLLASPPAPLGHFSKDFKSLKFLF